MTSSLNRVALALSACSVLSSAATAGPPNVVLVITDDMGYADVGFNGCRDIPTPHIDRIANEGVRFTNGYVTYAVCGPSRAAIMTGRYQDRFGFCRNPTIDPADASAGIPLSERTLAEALRPAGYTSMAVGKWHLGTHPTLWPLERGFDEFFGFLSGGHDYFPERLTLEDLSEVTEKWGWYRTKLLRNRQRVVIDDYLTDELSDAAVEFIERRHAQPFFVYLAYNAPHTPLQATDKYLDRFPHIADKTRRTYAAMVSAVDDGVGRVLDALDATGVADNTIVFFLSDNGGAANNASQNKPLRGAKGDFFEGGIRVPLAMRWPAKAPARLEYDQPVSSLDIFATVAAHAQVKPLEDRPLDGVDLIPYLNNRVAGAPHETLYWRGYDLEKLAIRSGNHKAVIGEKAVAEGLFELSADIAETKNLAGQQEAKLNHLRRRYETWNQEMIPPAFPRLGSWDPSGKSE